MLDWIIFIMLSIFVVATILVFLIDKVGLEFKIIETIGRKRLNWIIIFGILISAGMMIGVYLGILPDAVQKTICGWFTSTTQNMMGNACN